MPSGVTIYDKDGGIALELRGSVGAIPVYIPGTGDGGGRQYWQESISINSTGDQTVHASPSDKRFHIQTLVLETQHAGAAIRLKSGTGQNLSGVLRMAANTPLSSRHGENSPLQAKYAGDNFVVNSSGDYIVPYISGWVTGYDE